MKHLTLFIAVLTLMSCNSSKNLQKNQSGKVEFHTLAQASLHGNGKEGIKGGGYVFTDQENWLAFLQKINAVNDETGKFEALRQVDFDKNMLIAVFSQVLGSGGSKIEISSIVKDDNSIRVNVKRSGGSGMAIMVMNQPFHIVSIPKDYTPVIFEGLKLK